jgi:hypothetical protein
MHEWIVRIAWLILGALLGLIIGYILGLNQAYKDLYK